MVVALPVQVLLFARLRELAGERSLELRVPAAGATVRGVLEAAVERHPRLRGADAGVRVAVNEEYASWDRPVQAGDAVAFIPPVAGGAPEPAVHVRLTTDPLDSAAAEALVRTDADGAVCTFTGVVRNHAEGRAVDHLEYEAYPEMAEPQMRRVGEEALRRTGATAVVLWHRTGSLAIGEASVVVSASAPHRAEAFEACRYAIDTLKADVPIWKKEHGDGGAVWVDETERNHSGTPRTVS
ncbi:MAG TPA: molybdopterin converting factor subunit 1 [Candidatus Dormibacteraeota bacterium]|nr:molybdopterin converting factor subunit 1 [Candidatus Dormibacteraeota bacterium]